MLSSISKINLKIASRIVQTILTMINLRYLFVYFKETSLRLTPHLCSISYIFFYLAKMMKDSFSYQCNHIQRLNHFWISFTFIAFQVTNLNLAYRYHSKLTYYYLKIIMRQNQMKILPKSYEVLLISFFF